MSGEEGPRFHEGNYKEILRGMVGNVEKEDIEALRNKFDDHNQKQFDKLSYEDKMRQVVFDKLTNAELRSISHIVEQDEEKHPTGLHDLKNQILLYALWLKRNINR